MSDSGFPLSSRDVPEFHGPPWPESPSPETDDSAATPSLALSILSEKIRSGVLQRTELMQRIVAHASAATGAKGVALALRRNQGGRVVCCAATGDMAPPPGTALDEGSGFTAECLRNGVVLISNDSRTDARVDQVACARLGVRSIVAAPVADEGSTVGVLEALSDQPSAFSKQHIEILLTLACFARSAIVPTEGNVRHMSSTDLVAIPRPAADPRPKLEPKTLPYPDFWQISRILRVPRRVRSALAGGVAAALLLALLATAVFVWMWGHKSGAGMSRARRPKAEHTGVAKPPTVQKPPAAIVTSIPLHEPEAHKQTRQNGAKPLAVKESATQKTLAGEPASATSGTLSPDGGNEVAPPAFTQPTQDSAELRSILSSPGHTPSVVLATSEGFRPARLERRVTPVYPPEARRLRIEGPVMLRVTIDEQGTVQSIAFVKGSPILARAAMAAVRQWRFQPSQLNHHSTASTTDVTVVFRLE